MLRKVKIRREIAHRLSCRFPTTAARVRSQVKTCGTYHRLLHNHVSTEAGTIDPLVAAVPSGTSLTLPHRINTDKNVKLLSMFN
jgi:hypothetical protein